MGWRPVAGNGDGDIRLSSITLQDVSGTQKLFLTYEEALDPDSVPAVGDFSLNASRTVSAVAISGDSVVIDFSPAYDENDSPEVTYTPGDNPIQRLRGVEAGSIAGRAAAIVAASVAVPVASLVTQTSQTPTDTGITLNGVQNAIRIFSEPTDFRTTTPWTDYWIKINSEPVKQLRLYYWQSRYIVAPTGATIGIGTTNGATIKYHAVNLNLDAVPALPGSTTTATANCDKSCPPYWIPTAAHITFPPTTPAETRVFSVETSATHQPFFVSEYDGTSWTPPRFYKQDPNKATVIQCSYTQVALATYDGRTISITAPTGTTIGGSSALISITLPTPTQTYNVSTVGDLETRLLAAVSGDRIVLADGTYSLTQAIDERWAGVQLISQSNNPDACIITGNTFTIRGALPAPADTTPNYIRGIRFTVDDGILLEDATFRVDNCKFENTVSGDCFNYSSPNAGNSLLVVNSDASNAEADCWNFDGESLSAITDRDVHLVCCTGETAGNNNNSQILTTHTGLPISVFGCVFSNAQFNISANDGTDGATTYSFFSNFTRGARQGGVIHTSLFGCYCDHGTGPGDNQENSYFSYRKASPVGVGGTGIARNFTGKILSSYLEIDTGVGRVVFNNSVGGGEVRASIMDNAGEAILLDFISGGPHSPAFECINNTFINNTEAIQQNTELPLNLVNSAAKDNGSSIVTTSGGFAEITGSSNTLDANVDADYTGLTGDTLAVDAALDSALRPTASGNCDENGTVPNTQILGLSDPFGLVLVQDVATIPRGARARLVNNADIYPDAV